MLAEGNPAARGAVYDDPEVGEAFPMADLIRDSIDTAGAAAAYAYYTDVSGRPIRDFHPPARVDPDPTPRPGRRPDRKRPAATGSCL